MPPRGRHRRRFRLGRPKRHDKSTTTDHHRRQPISEESGTHHEFTAANQIADTPPAEQTAVIEHRTERHPAFEQGDSAKQKHPPPLPHSSHPISNISHRHEQKITARRPDRGEDRVRSTAPHREEQPPHRTASARRISPPSRSHTASSPISSTTIRSVALCGYRGQRVFLNASYASFPLTVRRRPPHNRHRTVGLSTQPSASSPLTRPAAHASTTIVTGPSASMEIRIWAPKLPVATSRPRPRSASTTASTSGSATGPGAAAFQDGRRPLRTSA